MIFILICAYLGVWACAYAAVHSGRGRFGFWLFYAVAVGLVPLVSGFCLTVLFRMAAPNYAASITPLSIQIGMVMALIVYPVKYLRLKVEE